MKSGGVDLHKKVISICVLVQSRGRRVVSERRTLRCDQVEQIEAFFRQLGAFQMTVEATSSYEWFVKLIEPVADRVVLAHPRKLRVIAESTRKTDKLDAQVLAEFLALDMIPPAHRPAPRLREYRALVRQRQYVQRRITSLKNRLRHLLSHYNADVPHLFSQKGHAYLKGIELSASDRFVVEQLQAALEYFAGQVADCKRRSKTVARRRTGPEGRLKNVVHLL